MRPQGELTRRYLVNTLANAALKIASVLASLWATRELVEALGPVEFGLVTLSASLAGFFSFLGLGLPAGLVRQVASLHGRGEPERIWRLVRVTVGIFGGIGVLGALGLVAITALGGMTLLALPEDARGAATAAALATAAVVAVSWPLSVFTATLTGLQRIPALNGVTGVAALVSAGVTVLVAVRGGGAMGVVLAGGAVLALSGAMQAFLVRRLLPSHGTGEGSGPGIGDEIRPLFSFGVWVLALEVAALVIYQTDQLILGVLYSVESLTAYHVAIRLHNLIREGNSVLISALFPMIAEEHARGNEAAMEQVLYRGTRYATAILAPVTLAAILLAAPFLSWWMGPEYSNLAFLAQGFLSYWFLAVLTSTPAQVALGRGESAVLGKIALFGAVVNLGLSLLLVRRFGIAGVMAGTLAAYVVAIPAQIVFVFPRLGIDRARFGREVILPVYGVLAPLGIGFWLALRGLPAPEGVVALLLRGALVVGSCWSVLWFVAIEPRDRRRVTSRLVGRREGSA